MQEAMRQREAEWQSKKAAQRKDSFVGWTRRRPEFIGGSLAGPDKDQETSLDCYLIDAKETTASLFAGDSSVDYPRDGYHHHDVHKGKFIVCDHCRSHGLPCDEDAVCSQCVHHEVACVHHWCKLSKDSKEECPRTDCHYVHKDHMPTSEFLKGVEWLVVPGNLRGYMSAGRKGRLYGPNDSEHDTDDGIDGSDGNWDEGEDDVLGVSDIQSVKAIQEQGLADMTACVARREASWETVVLTCACVAQEQEDVEVNLKERMERMAKNRRGDAFLIRYE
ncbi:hypothetical protein LTR53_009398 [Teratosphaeriaceae sp. CCFEE 6253]|nr:hypothetical protein LTR53_009398 [Teratosphaeriaceae sp. CCFEE 6253]